MRAEVAVPTGERLTGHQNQCLLSEWPRPAGVTAAEHTETITVRLISSDQTRQTIRVISGIS